MNAPDHPADERLLQHYDGTLDDDDAAIADHVASCPLCRSRLDELAALDAFVVARAPQDAMADAAMFAAAERALSQPSHGSWRRHALPLLLALVAAGLALAVWLGSTADRCRLHLEHYRAADPLRAAATARFHLAIEAPEPVFVIALARLADGTCDELLPGAMAPVAVRGTARLPANELLDWEYPAARAPREVLVVVTTAPPGDAARRNLATAVAATPLGEVPPIARELGEATLLPFAPAAGR